MNVSGEIAIKKCFATNLLNVRPSESQRPTFGVSQCMIAGPSSTANAHHIKHLQMHSPIADLRICPSIQTSNKALPLFIFSETETCDVHWISVLEAHRCASSAVCDVHANSSILANPMNPLLCIWIRDSNSDIASDSSNATQDSWDRDADLTLPVVWSCEVVM